MEAGLILWHSCNCFRTRMMQWTICPQFYEIFIFHSIWYDGVKQDNVAVTLVPGESGQVKSSSHRGVLSTTEGKLQESFLLTFHSKKVIFVQTEKSALWMFVSSVLVSCNDQVQTSDISHSYLNSTDWPEDVKREYALQRSCKWWLWWTLELKTL